MRKEVNIPTDGYYEEISSITNSVIGDIQDALCECFDEPNVNITKAKILDQCRHIITGLYYSEEEDDVLIDTTISKGDRLREEPINIIMDVAEYLNIAF